MRLFRKEAREEGLKEGREEGLKQGLEEGLEQGLKQGQNRLINTMLQNGASPEHLSEITGLSLSEINAITKNKKS